MCFLVEFDLLFALSVLSLNCVPCLFMFMNTIAYAFRYQPRKQLYLIAFGDLVPVTTEKSYPVEYCLESVEEYSECTIHKGEPEPRKGNVNIIYFINQARANTQISCTEFIYDESMQLQMVLLILTFELPA